MKPLKNYNFTFMRRRTAHNKIGNDLNEGQLKVNDQEIFRDCQKGPLYGGSGR